MMVFELRLERTRELVMCTPRHECSRQWAGPEVEAYLTCLGIARRPLWLEYKEHGGHESELGDDHFARSVTTWAFTVTKWKVMQDIKPSISILHLLFID